MFGVQCWIFHLNRVFGMILVLIVKSIPLTLPVTRPRQPKFEKVVFQVPNNSCNPIIIPYPYTFIHGARSSSVHNGNNTSKRKERGVFRTLQETVEILGHVGRTIHIFKISNESGQRHWPKKGGIARMRGTAQMRRKAIQGLFGNAGDHGGMVCCGSTCTTAVWFVMSPMRLAKDGQGIANFFPIGPAQIRIAAAGCRMSHAIAKGAKQADNLRILGGRVNQVHQFHHRQGTRFGRRRAEPRRIVIWFPLLQPSSKGLTLSATGTGCLLRQFQLIKGNRQALFLLVVGFVG